ncbi:MAG: BlaI/MecI/CopY family transcriptional regulator [Nannocystaceae bacterium]
MGATEHLGKLQFSIMRVLWEQGEAAVNDVYEALRESHGLAPTTVATMLKKMEHKGVVCHRTVGRRFIYRPIVSERSVKRSMVAELAQRLFNGNKAALVHHLLDEHEIDPSEVAALQEQIEAVHSAKGSDQ